MHEARHSVLDALLPFRDAYIRRATILFLQCYRCSPERGSRHVCILCRLWLWNRSPQLILVCSVLTHNSFPSNQHCFQFVSPPLTHKMEVPIQESYTHHPPPFGIDRGRHGSACSESSRRMFSSFYSFYGRYPAPKRCTPPFLKPCCRAPTACVSNRAETCLPCSNARPKY